MAKKNISNPSTTLSITAARLDHAHRSQPWKIMSIARREPLKGAGGRSKKFRAVGAHGGGAPELCKMSQN
jgi:hypothetical protein